MHRIHNADIFMSEDYDIDDLVDVIEGSRVYIPAIYVVNKIDQVRAAGGGGGLLADSHQTQQGRRQREGHGCR